MKVVQYLLCIPCTGAKLQISGISNSSIQRCIECTEPRELVRLYCTVDKVVTEGAKDRKVKQFLENYKTPSDK